MTDSIPASETESERERGFIEKCKQVPLLLQKNSLCLGFSPPSPPPFVGTEWEEGRGRRRRKEGYSDQAERGEEAEIFSSSVSRCAKLMCEGGRGEKKEEEEVGRFWDLGDMNAAAAGSNCT